MKTDIKHTNSKALKYAAAAFLATLSLISVCVYYLSVYNYKLYRAEFDNKLINIVKIASETIDADKHQLLTDESQTNSELYAEVVQPLVDIHNAIPDITYLYTMIFDDEKSYFIIDSAMSPRLITDKQLTGSTVMEEYVEHEFFRDSIAAINKGQTYVYSDVYEDDFGLLITAAAPLSDNEKVIGFVAVDFDATYFAQYNREFYRHVVIAVIVAIVLSSLIGILVYTRARNSEILKVEQFRMAMTDQLTGVFNRRFIDDIFKQAVKRFVNHGEVLSVLLVDFDHFKKINDQYGHQAGDTVLKQSVILMKQALRPCDQVVRWGGEEFLIFLPNTSDNEALEIAERLRVSTENNAIQIQNDLAITVTVSIGLAAIQNKNVSELLNRVDEALYDAKASGRNCIKIA